MRLSFEFANVLGAVYHRGTLKFGPDGKSVFSPVGNKIIVFDLQANRSSALPLQVNNNIERIAIHPKGTILIASSESSHFYIISLVCGRLLHLKIYKKLSSISHISFSPDGRFYCVCGDNLALIYITPGSMIAGKGREIIPFRLLRKFRVNYDSITDVCWSADSNLICITSSDMSLSIYSLVDRSWKGTCLKGHSDHIIRCFFSDINSHMQIFSLTKNCQLFIWDETELMEDSDDGQTRKRARTNPKFYRSAKHYLKLVSESDETKELKARKANAYITACDYNSNARILVIAYNTGHYSLYEMPNVTLIYDFDSDIGSISSMSINYTGDWIAFGSSVGSVNDANLSSNQMQSRLVVWEWQSKSHIFDQVGSGATMLNTHECVSYSPDGTLIVSGNQSGRIKVWSSLTGETIAEFGEEHQGPIKSIRFAPNKSGKVVISASLDGTLRAYDLNKFKNFRTFKSPVAEKRPEFICVDMDPSGEFIAAGTYNYFEVYLYSLQTGKFLEYLTGHEGPVSGVAFSPTNNLLVTTSWDQSIRIWNLFEGSKCMRDIINLSHEVITVAFRPDGHQFAVSISNGQIAFFDPSTADQLGAPIEGAADLGTTQLLNEVSRETKKYFITLNYSADGTFLLAAGKSNLICFYHAQEKILIKKIAITFNMSMDGLFDYISSRRRCEFGFRLELLDERQEERKFKPIQLPGTRKTDLGERQVKPVMVVFQAAFSPTMRSFSVATTEGVLIYSLDVSRHFDPYKLVMGVDPVSIKEEMSKRNFGQALVQSIQLNDKNSFREVMERTPSDDIDSIISNLGNDYVRRILCFISQVLPETRHLEYYLIWVKKLLYRHGLSLKNVSASDTTSIIRGLHQCTQRIFMDIKRNQDYCKYSLQFLTRNAHSEADEKLDNIDE